MCEIPSSDTLTQLDANAILRECRGEVIHKFSGFALCIKKEHIFVQQWYVLKNR